MDFGRPSSDFRRSPEFAANRRDFRVEPQHRSRSQNRVDPEFVPTDYSLYNRPIDKNSRSKSLDYRDAFREDDPYFGGERGGRGVTIPIRQERSERNYDYDKEFDSRRQWIETPRGREMEVPMERIRTARSSEYLDRADRRPQNDDRRVRPERQSPKSISSNKRPQNLNLSFEAARPRRIEQPPMDYRRGEEYGMRRDGSREIHRGDVGGGERREASRGGHSRWESNYAYESGAAGRGGVSPRRITQQPQPGHAISPPNYGAPGPSGYGARPVQYRKIRCCCFTLIWPPWSNEPTNPPQPIYRNI